jgi:excinuclease ABC subunit C
MRNEAHRFGINFHRDKRSSGMTKSELDNIKGIGLKTKEILLKNFDSPEKIGKTPAMELEKLVGRNKAGILMKFYKNQP